MVTQLINTDQVQPKTITVASGPVNATLAPTLQVGQILPLIVRQNGTGGNGMIFFQGQLFPALLPENLAVGERLMAQVTDLEDQVILKLVDPNAQTPKGNAPALDRIQLDQLKTLLESLLHPTSGQLTPPQKTTLPVALEKLIAQSNVISAQLKEFATVDQLEDPKTTLAQLTKQLASAPDTLRALASQLRQITDEETSTPELRLLEAIRTQLAELLPGPGSPGAILPPLDPRVFNRTLDQILNTLTSELRDTKKPQTQVRQLLRTVQEDLTHARQNEEGSRAAVQTALGRISDSLLGLAPHRLRLDPKDLDQLKEFASKLDQMASSYEAMSQLNQLMNTLGEPAMLLFPFLFQGMLLQGEVTVEPRLTPRKEGVDEDGNEGSGKGDGSAFQRVHIAVPLPGLGLVDVDIAHRESELYARFSVEDPEVGAFLTEQLEHLVSYLRERGFEKAELVAHVGPREHLSPAWVEALSATTSIFA